MVERKHLLGRHLLVAHDDIACDACGRTLTTGEQVAVLDEPGRQRRVVCEPCAPSGRRAPARQAADRPRAVALVESIARGAPGARRVA